MNISSVSAGNVPVSGQIASEPQSAEAPKADVPETTVPAPKTAEEPAVKVELGKTQTPVNSAAEKAEAAQIDTKEQVFQSVLKELSSAVEERTALIKSLPPDIKEVTQEILSKTLADSATISKGMIATIKAEKSAVEQLQTFTALLTDAEQLMAQMPEKTLKSLADLLQNFDADFNGLVKAATLEEASGQETLMARSQESTITPSLETVKGQEMPPSTAANEQAAVQNLPDKGESAPFQVRKNRVDDNPQQVNEAKPDVLSKPAAENAKDTGPDITTKQPDSGAFVKSANDETKQPAADKNFTSQTAPTKEQPGIVAEPNKSGNFPARQNIVEEPSANPSGQPARPQPDIPLNQQAQSTEAPLQQAAEPNKATNQGAVTYQSNKSELPQQEASQLRSLPAEKFAASSQAGQSEAPSLENFVLNLAKQLAGNGTPQQAAVKTTILEYLQKSPLGENDDSSEAAVLKQTVESFAQNAPEIVRFAAGKHNLPQLPQLWALVKLHKALEWTKLEQEKLQETIRSMREMTASMKSSVAFSGEKIDNNSALSFSMPLYLGEGMQPYPAYIHLYHQRQKGQKESGGEYTYETWLRICLSTENIGPVDIVFRLYQENLLNVKVAFSRAEAAQGFNSFVPNIRESLDESALDLVEVSVNTKPDLGG